MKNRIDDRIRAGVVALALAVVSLAFVSAASADSAAYMRWWNALSPEQMVAALHGDKATEAQAKAAKKMYADLDADTRKLVDAAAESIYGDGGFDSVGQWWGDPGLPVDAGGRGRRHHGGPFQPFLRALSRLGRGQDHDRGGDETRERGGPGIAGAVGPGQVSQVKDHGGPAGASRSPGTLLPPGEGFFFFRNRVSGCGSAWGR